jgi:hypothetical protein
VLPYALAGSRQPSPVEASRPNHLAESTPNITSMENSIVKNVGHIQLNPG